MTLQEFFDTDYFKSLVFEANCYRALEQGGVDNWEWYCESYTDYCNELGANSIDDHGKYVYEDYIDIRCMDLKNMLYLPIAQYRLTMKNNTNYEKCNYCGEQC